MARSLAGWPRQGLGPAPRPCCCRRSVSTHAHSGLHRRRRGRGLDAGDRVGFGRRVLTQHALQEFLEDLADLRRVPGHGHRKRQAAPAAGQEEEGSKQWPGTSAAGQAGFRSHRATSSAIDSNSIAGSWAGTGAAAAARDCGLAGLARDAKPRFSPVNSADVAVIPGAPPPAAAADEAPGAPPSSPERRGRKHSGSAMTRSDSAKKSARARGRNTCSSAGAPVRPMGGWAEVEATCPPFLRGLPGRHGGAGRSEAGYRHPGAGSGAGPASRSAPTPHPQRTGRAWGKRSGRQSGPRVLPPFLSMPHQEEEEVRVSSCL